MWVGRLMDEPTPPKLTVVAKSRVALASLREKSTEPVSRREATAVIAAIPLLNTAAETPLSSRASCS
jgi:hypothetical protein